MQCPLAVTSVATAESTTPEPEKTEEPDSHQVSPDPRCVNGKLFHKCGTACPLTCDNYRSRSACADVCVEGCFCPQGLLEDGDGWCVPPFACPGELFCFILVEYMNIALTVLFLSG